MKFLVEVEADSMFGSSEIRDMIEDAVGSIGIDGIDFVSVERYRDQGVQIGNFNRQTNIF